MESKGTRVRVTREAHYGLRLLAAKLTERAAGRREFSLVDAIDYAVAEALKVADIHVDPERA